MMVAILLILIFARPFVSSLAFPYLNSLYSAVLMGFLIIWIIIKKISLRKTGPLKYPLILFCLALIISLVFSVNKLNSFKEIYKYLGGVLIFLTVASLTDKDKIKILRVITFGGFIISLLAIYQYLFGFQHLLEYIDKQKVANSFTLDYISQKRAFFPFVTPNTLAGYLIIIMPLAFIHKNRIWFIIPLSFALLLTQSLGALISLFLALAFYLYLRKKSRTKTVLFLFGLLVIIGLVFMLRLSSQKQHFQPIFSTIMRLNYWKDTLEIIKAKPLTGVGIGNFNLIHSRYAHNSYLQIWAEMGILGLISILWLIIEVFKSYLKNINNSYYIAGLLIANIVFLIHNFVDFTFFLPEISLLWWITLGLIKSFCGSSTKG